MDNNCGNLFAQQQQQKYIYIFKKSLFDINVN